MDKKLEIGKLETTPIDLSKLSDVIKEMLLLKRLNMKNWFKKLIILRPQMKLVKLDRKKQNWYFSIYK